MPLPRQPYASGHRVILPVALEEVRVTRQAGWLALLLTLTGCGSSGGSAPASDGGSLDADATSHTFSDSGADSPLGHHDGRPADAVSTDEDSGGGRDSSGDSSGDSPCEIVDGGHSAPLTWNEACGQPVAAFQVAWGHADGGPYPNTIDAGFACDASACSAGGSNPQLFCSYLLKGLATGDWCIATAACDDAGCSGSSGQVCVSVPLRCP